MKAEKTVVITGANSGIGFQMARHFAQTGAKVVMACRSMDKARRAQQQIQAEVPTANTLLLPLDVSDLDSVRAFSEQYSTDVGMLDLLINNAGIAAVELTRNNAGHELHMATNYLGAFALTGLLLPQFSEDKPARIVNVGSLAHRTGKMDVDDLNWDKNEYSRWQAYVRSKVAMLTYTLELNRRLQANPSTSNIIALAGHPGFANTEIGNKSEALKPQGAFRIWFTTQMEKIVPSAEDAARPVIFAATAEHVSGGDYYGPGGFLEIGGKPGKARLNPVTKDKQLAKKLWAVSETMSGVSYLSDL